MDDTTTPLQPPLQTNKERYTLDKVPLISISCVSVLSFFLAIYFGLRYGYVVSIFGKTVVMQGSMLLVLLNICFTFWTLKVISIVTTSKYPTWQLISELRDTIVKLGAGTIVGNALFLATIYWNNHYDDVRGSLAPNIEEKSLNLLNAFGDLDVPFIQDRSKNDGFTGNDALLLENTTDGKSHWSENATNDYMDFSGNSTVRFESATSLPGDGTEGQNNSNGNVNGLPGNDISLSRNSTVGPNIPNNKSENKNEPVLPESFFSEFYSDSRGPERSASRVDLEDLNPLFTSSFACSFTFLTAGAVTIIALFVEKRSINILREREENANNTSSSKTAPDNSTMNGSATHITALSDPATSSPTHKAATRKATQGNTSTFCYREGKLSPYCGTYTYDPKLAEPSVAYDGGSEVGWQSPRMSSKARSQTTGGARPKQAQRHDHGERIKEAAPCVDHVLPHHQVLFHDVHCSYCSLMVMPSEILARDLSLSPAKRGKTAKFHKQTFKADIHEGSQRTLATASQNVRSPTKSRTTRAPEGIVYDYYESKEVIGPSTESITASKVKKDPVTNEVLESIEMTSTPEVR